MELRLQLHEQHHVWRSIRDHAGAFPHQGPRNWKRPNCNGEPYFRGYGELFSALPLSKFNEVRLQAPIIALYANLTTSVPIFIAGAIFIVSAVLPLLLPFDTQGSAAL